MPVDRLDITAILKTDIAQLLTAPGLYQRCCTIADTFYLAAAHQLGHNRCAFMRLQYADNVLRVVVDEEMQAHALLKQRLVGKKESYPVLILLRVAQKQVQADAALSYAVLGIELLIDG